MNRPVELLFSRYGRRNGIQDIDQFAQVLQLQKEAARN